MSIVRVTLFQTYWAQSVQNVLHFDDNVSTYNPTNIKNDIVANWIPNIGQLQNAVLTYVGVAVKCLQPAESTTSFFAVSIGGSSFALAYSLSYPALVVKIETATPGYRGRGRFYIAGLPGAGYDSGRFNSATLSVINTEIANVWAAYGPSSSISPMQIGVMGRDITSTFHPATNLLPRAVPGVQRRRNLGVGI